MFLLLIIFRHPNKVLSMVFVITIYVLHLAHYFELEITLKLNLNVSFLIIKKLVENFWDHFWNQHNLLVNIKIEKGQI